MSPQVCDCLARLSGNRRHRRSLIGLTPLIDVVFILLVFFMLVSSFVDWRAIRLNVPGQAAKGSVMDGALLVEVRGDGLRLSGETLTLDALATRVAERVAVRPEQRVVVKPAPGIVLQETVVVLDRLAGAGVADLSLVRHSGR